MPENKAMLLYHDRMNIVNALSDEEAGELLKAMLAYSIDKTEKEFKSRAAMMAFISVRPDLDYSYARYEEICKKRSDAGKKGMAGAAILSARSCMRSGAGKLTIHTPEYNVRILQESVPEAIINIDVDQNCFSQSFDTSEYDAMAIGPGIGTSSYTVQAFIEQVSMSKCPMVLDADALNILGSHRGWIAQLPRRCILTPHKKELFGLISTTRNSYEELERTRELAMRQQIYIIIKGAYSAVVTPEGNAYFNTTGNPGMATAGAGDVLTGIILSLLAQSYVPEVAARLGVYLHGLAGDCAMKDHCYESLISSDLIAYLPQAFKYMRNKD